MKPFCARRRALSAAAAPPAALHRQRVPAAPGAEDAGAAEPAGANIGEPQLAHGAQELPDGKVSAAPPRRALPRPSARPDARAARPAASTRPATASAAAGSSSSKRSWRWAAPRAPTAASAFFVARACELAALARRGGRRGAGCAGACLRPRRRAPGPRRGREAHRGAGDRRGMGAARGARARDPAPPRRLSAARTGMPPA
jgi:hypothetical protein